MRFASCVALITLCVAYHTVTAQKKATIAALDTLKGVIEQLLTDDSQNIGGFVRVAFHDCVGKGGCDGCLNPTEPDNAGLLKYTIQLDDVYEEFSDLISRADLYAYAAVVALDRASDAFDTSSFRVGRVDCSADGIETDAEEKYPSSNMKNMEEVAAYFAKEFGFNTRETVALLGAHTLGRARTENSGFEGPWVPGANGPNVLDNTFYRELVGPRWFHKTLQTENHFQWQKNRGSGGAGNTPETRGDNQPNVLLNSDGALAFDMDLNEHGDMNSQCEMCGRSSTPVQNNIPCCAHSQDGYAICNAYARSNALWLSEFTNVFYKMIDHSESQLTAPSNAVVTEAPVVETTEAPVDTTEAPVDTTETPVDTTKAPVKTTKPPVKTTRAPTNPPRPPRPGPGGRGPGGRGPGGRGGRRDEHRAGKKDEQRANVKKDINHLLEELDEIRKQVKDF